MIVRMNEKALHILEYDKIIDKLTDLAHSEPGKEKCRSLAPMDDIDSVNRAQEETADAVARVLRLGRISFQGNRNLSFSLHALTLGSSLSQAELLHIAEVLECTFLVKKYAEKEHD